MLKFLTLTSNEEGSRFLLKSYSFVREIKAYFLNLCASLKGGEVMNRLVCFLMVGLVFTVLQVSTVGAQSPSGSADPNAPVLTIGDPACATVPPAAGCPAGSPGMAPPTGAPPVGTTRGADPSCMPLADGSLPPHCNYAQKLAVLLDINL